MKLVRHLIPTSILCVVFAGVAAATPLPVVFTLDSVTVVGALAEATQTYTPDPPTGLGFIDVDLGVGEFNLDSFNVFIEVAALASTADVETVGWQQTVAFLPGLAGAGEVTSTAAGLSTCVPMGTVGSLICASAEGPVAPWPPAGGTATINTLAQTLSTVSATDPQAGTTFSEYSWTVVPEPGTAVLMGGGLVGLAMQRRRARRRRWVPSRSC